jgi:hypothetical protein
MAIIRCSVESCHYYGEGDYCTADEIYVKNRLRGDTDDDRRRSLDLEVGSFEQQDAGEQMGRRNARSSMETCCETFRPKQTESY